MLVEGVINGNNCIVRRSLIYINTVVRNIRSGDHTEMKTVAHYKMLEVPNQPCQENNDRG